VSHLYFADYSFEGYIALSSTKLKSITAYFKVLFKSGNAVTVARIAFPGNKGLILGRCGSYYSPQGIKTGSGTHPPSSPVGTEELFHLYVASKVSKKRYSSISGYKIHSKIHFQTLRSLECIRTQHLQNVPEEGDLPLGYAVPSYQLMNIKICVNKLESLLGYVIV
jgi:hypothetical protein